MFKFSDIAIFKWSLGQKRNKHLYDHLYDHHDFWLLFDKRNEKRF